MAELTNLEPEGRDDLADRLRAMRGEASEMMSTTLDGDEDQYAEE